MCGENMTCTTRSVVGTNIPFKVPYHGPVQPGGRLDGLSRFARQLQQLHHVLAVKQKQRLWEKSRGTSLGLRMRRKLALRMDAAYRVCHAGVTAGTDRRCGWSARESKRPLS